MKILLINHFPLTGSGSGVYNMTIANALIKKGHEVRIIAPENIKINDKLVHPVYFTDKEEIEGALPFNFPCFTTHPRSTTTFYDLTDSELSLYEDAFYKAIYEEINTFKPDIIHASHIWILSYVASKFDVPLVITAHGTDLIGYQKEPRFREEANIAADKAYEIVTISEDNQKAVLDTFKGIENKVTLIKNGYDTSIFYKEDCIRKDVLKHFGILKEYKNVVSFAGKFTHFKGIDLLLKAASIYQNEDTLTLLCGNGQLFEEMKELSKSLGLKNIVFLGNRPHEELRKIYSIADVSLVPSRNEAFGLVVIEALACGTPVIGTNQGGIAEILNDKVGMTFEPEDYEDLAKKIQLVLDKKVVFDRDIVHNYAYDNYSEDELIKPLIKIYEKRGK